MKQQGHRIKVLGAILADCTGFSGFQPVAAMRKVSEILKKMREGFNPTATPHPFSTSIARMQTTSAFRTYQSSETLSPSES